MASSAYAQIERISVLSIHTATSAATARDILAVASQRSIRRTSSRPTGAVFRHRDCGHSRNQCHRPGKPRDRAIGIRSAEATSVLWKDTMRLQSVGHPPSKVTPATSLKMKLLLAAVSYCGDILAQAPQVGCRHQHSPQHRPAALPESAAV